MNDRNPNKRDAKRDLILALAIVWPSVGLLVLMGWAFKWWKIGGYLDHFQTLVTGLIAIVAAVVAAYFVQKQINLARDQEDERINRLFDAGRATLPLTLKGVIRYSDECADFLLAARRGETGEDAPPAPLLDPATVTQLRDMVAASPKNVRTQIAVLLGELQVQASRTEGFVRRGKWSEATSAFTADQFLAANATIGAICDRMFPFARRETEVIDLQLTGDDIRSAMRAQGLDRRRHTRAYGFADTWARSISRKTPG